MDPPVACAAWRARLLAAIAALPAAALPCATAGCTVVKPVVCALAYPIERFSARLESRDEDDDYSELPPVATFAAAPVLIPLNWAYFTVYGAVGGLISGFVSDLNLITGHGSLRNSRATITQPLRTNAVRPR